MRNVSKQQDYIENDTLYCTVRSNIFHSSLISNVNLVFNKNVLTIMFKSILGEHFNFHVATLINVCTVKESR